VKYPLWTMSFCAATKRVANLQRAGVEMESDRICTAIVGYGPSFS
jgi:hypothetical protein